MIYRDDKPPKKKPDLGMPFVDAVSGDIETADHFQVMRCGDTSHAHIVLFDESGDPFAQLTVTPSNVDTILMACDDIFSSPRKQ